MSWLFTFLFFFSFFLSSFSYLLFLDGKTNLLVEPIHLPEMVHVQLDPSRLFPLLLFILISFSFLIFLIFRADSQETRLFYATGEKNPNLNKHIENALKNNTLEYQEAHIHSSLAHTAHSRTKPRFFFLFSLLFC